MARLIAAVTSPVVRLTTVDSTQRFAAELARNGAADGTAVVADTQTAGKGRRGRAWHDTPGASLLVSVIMRTSLPPARRATLSLLAGVAVAETLRTAGVTAKLKWPNDALVNGKKIAGVLLEAYGDAVVVGIGINVAREAVPPALEERATSVAQAGGVPDRELILHALLRALDDWRSRLERESFDAVRERWTSLSETVGNLVSADRLTGTAVGIDHDGALLIATDAGVVRVIAGDVAAG
jgi:BirA family biotin operon repressor/biotin-[acetyl-CoA-carboxylase] ligase